MNEFNSAIDTLGRLKILQYFFSSSPRAILPSFPIISHMTAAGLSPANFINSNAASVCPCLAFKPPFAAIRGKTCPGLLKSHAFLLSSASALTVFALSNAVGVLQEFAARLHQPIEAA